MMVKGKGFWIGMASILFFLLVIGVLGFKEYDTMKNPHEAFGKDLKSVAESVYGENADNKDDRRLANPNVINLLLLGVDSTEAREASSMGYRSDAIMVVSMDLVTKHVKVISIPRDSYTKIPGNNKKDKINHAMAFGRGPREKGNDYAVEAVENLLNIDINYYVTMDLDAIKNMVDTIGGVTINVERNMGSGKARLVKGEQTLNGEQALAYLSNRKAPTADLARIEQQQKFMMALFQQTKEKGRFSDVLPLYLKLQDKIFTNLSIEQIGSLVLFAKDLQPKDIEMFTLKGKNMFIDDIYYLDIDRDYMEEVLN